MNLDFLEHCMNTNKGFFFYFALGTLLFLGMNCFPAFGNKKKNKGEAIQEGMTLPQFTLKAPDSSDEQKYLGLNDLKSFSLSQIPAKIIIFEVFSIYCPHCRIQAPVLNKVYKLIQQDPQLINGIKMLGLAAAADKRKVDRWKQALHVPFPIIPDPETIIWKKIGKPGVPCTLVLTSNGKVLLAHYGSAEDKEEFFRRIIKIYKEQK